MTCDDVRDQLEAFEAGALTVVQREQVEAHLAGCSECRTDLDALQALGPLVAALPRHLEPERDLWSDIRGRLRGGRGPARVSVPVWFLIAASLLLVVGTSLVTRQLTPRQAATGLTLASGFVEAEAGYVSSVVKLSQSYAASRDKLAPETREVIDRNLAVIERALNEAREALARDPRNASIETLVLAAYRRKVEFLERANAIERES